MFVRPCWTPKNEGASLQLIDENPWALLVSSAGDVPLATNLPLLLAPDSSRGVQLVGHLAIANEHLALLRAHPDNVLAIFEGPWSYVTASWYPARQMPSTYYYTAVHCRGRVEFEQEQELDLSLEDLTRRMERHYPQGWSASEIPRSEITRRFKSIAGFRIVVTGIEAKFKLGQDEPRLDALAVADELETRNLAADRILAGMIRFENAGRA